MMQERSNRGQTLIRLNGSRKLWKSRLVTLFAMANPNIPIFKQVIDKYYDGVLDEKTLKILKVMQVQTV